MPKKVPKEKYGDMLEQYLDDIKEREILMSEVKRMETIERTFAFSPFDYCFPWHVIYGGRFEPE